MSILANVKEYSAARYEPKDELIWNEFVDASSNGTFLFQRSFMDYHKDRFIDNSYLVWDKNALIAIFVSGISLSATNKKILVGHPGLTYGGLVHKTDVKYYEIEKIFAEILRLAKSEGFEKIIIKPVARVFCRNYSEAQLFYFNANSFHLSSREINSVIDLTQEINITRTRKKNLRKADSLKLIISPSLDCSHFYNIMVSSLSKTHGVSPVHTLAELEYLMASHPNNIKYYAATLEGEVVGGTFLFIDEKRSFVHTQYTHANEKGREARAIDALVMNTIAVAQQIGLTKLSFGISTVQGKINPGLLSQKEDFGSVVELMDTYEFQL